jgi:hypothetical protein
MMDSSEPLVKPRAMQVCLFLVRLLLSTSVRRGTSSALAGLYRQFELYYVMGDERDIVRLRTNYRLEDVYLYRLIPATPERSRALFLDYIKTANELHDQAQWYNELVSNCTSNVRLHIKHIGSAHPWDWQLLVNGSIDEHAYDLGAINTSLPFAELKRLSHINDRARAAAGDPAFSSRIREGLPGIPFLVQDSAPIWSTAVSSSEGNNLVGASYTSFRRQITALRAYAKQHTVAFFVHALIIALLLGILYWARPRVKRWIEEEPSFERVAPIFNVPIATALVFSFLSNRWIYPLAPQLLVAALGVGLLIATTIVLRRLIERRLFPILNALLALYLLEQLRAVAASLPLLSRSLFIAEMLAGIFFLIWLIRSVRTPLCDLHGAPLRDPTRRILRRHRCIRFRYDEVHHYRRGIHRRRGIRVAEHH